MAIPIIIGCEIRSVILGPCPIPDRICKPERKTNDTVRRRRDDQAAVFRRSCTSTDDENITGSAQISDVGLGRYCWGTWRREPESKITLLLGFKPNAFSVTGALPAKTGPAHGLMIQPPDRLIAFAAAQTASDTSESTARALMPPWPCRRI